MSGKKKATRQAYQHVPVRPVELLKQVIAGRPEAWHVFVETYSGFLYALAWRYARDDVDVASELVLLALEGLRKPDSEGREFYRLRKYLDSLKVYGQQSRFVTWLALVTRNIIRDWIRTDQGRRILPREIKGMDHLEQEIFKLIFWQGLSEAETLSRLQCECGIQEQNFERHLNRVMKVLKGKRLFLIYRDLIRKPPMWSFKSQVFLYGTRLREVVDPRPQARPDLALEMIENQAMADWIGNLLNQAVDTLDGNTLKVLMMHAVRGLSGEVIAKIMGYGKRQCVYDELAKARRKIKSFLKKAGVDQEHVRRVTGYLNGWLRKNK